MLSVCTISAQGIVSTYELMHVKLLASYTVDDVSRVILMAHDGTDYINGAYVDVSKLHTWHTKQVHSGLMYITFHNLCTQYCTSDL